MCNFYHLLGHSSHHYETNEMGPKMSQRVSGLGDLNIVKHQSQSDKNLMMNVLPVPSFAPPMMVDLTLYDQSARIGNPTVFEVSSSKLGSLSITSKIILVLLEQNQGELFFNHH